MQDMLKSFFIRMSNLAVQPFRVRIEQNFEFVTFKMSFVTLRSVKDLNALHTYHSRLPKTDFCYE